MAPKRQDVESISKRLFYLQEASLHNFPVMQLCHEQMPPHDLTETRNSKAKVVASIRRAQGSTVGFRRASPKTEFVPTSADALFIRVLWFRNGLSVDPLGSSKDASDQLTELHTKHHKHLEVNAIRPPLEVCCRMNPARGMLQNEPT